MGAVPGRWLDLCVHVHQGGIIPLRGIVPQPKNLPLFPKLSWICLTLVVCFLRDRIVSVWPCSGCDSGGFSVSASEEQWKHSSSLLRKWGKGPMFAASQLKASLIVRSDNSIMNTSQRGFAPPSLVPQRWQSTWSRGCSVPVKIDCTAPFCPGPRKADD